MPSRLSVNSSNHSGRSRKRSPDTRLVSLFFVIVLFCFFVNRASFLVLRSVAGLEDVLDESCGSGVLDELVPEFDDSPGTTTGTTFSVWHRIFDPYLVRCGFWPLGHSAFSFVCTSPLAVTTVVGFLDLRKVSNSSELTSFSLIMCIGAP